MKTRHGAVFQAHSAADEARVGKANVHLETNMIRNSREVVPPAKADFPARWPNELEHRQELY